MFDEMDESFFDSADLAHLGDRSDPPVEVVLVLAVALLLLIDLVSGAHRGKLRLHLSLEVGAALLTLVAAARAWLRRVRLAMRTRRMEEPSPATAGEVESHIDGRLWSAIEIAIREECASPPLWVAPRRLPPAPRA
jgi:hypothetical protein